MSLIREALEKAGRKKEKVSPNPPPVAATIQEREENIKEWVREERARLVQELSQAKPKHNLFSFKIPFDIRKHAVTLLAIWGVLIFGLVFLWLYRTLTTTNFAVPTQNFASGVPAFVSHATPEPKFLLTGITESGNEKLALINNQVVGVNNTLKENAIVKDIQEKSVLLYFRGREIKLTL